MSDKSRQAHVMAIDSILQQGRGAYSFGLWVVDFCPSQTGAILEVYPDASIQYCVKHFDANIGKAIAKHGISPLAI